MLDRNASETKPPAAAATAVTFRWSQLEAGDYPTYMRNLRAVGCPEETIRDIITADVASQYAELRSNHPGAAGSNPRDDSSSVAPSQPGSPLHHEPASGRASADKEGTATNSAATSAAQPRPALSLQELDRQQANLLASLFPPSAISAPPPQPAIPIGAASGAATPMPASEVRTAESANAATAGVSATAPAPRRAPGYLTPEQQALRAKIGWQAFYFTTQMENDKVRATQGQSR